jgi:hypothetical protein
VYTFEKLIQDDYLYVDKTEYIWRMIEQPCGIYFLSRPRRFGKSLTLSTLKAVFQNKRHLFKGLALDSKPYNWKQYPVIHLDLGDRPSETTGLLRGSLIRALDEAAASLNISLSAENAPERFRELILAASAKERVVILIDEYDKPILDNISKPAVQEARGVLESFYSVIKATEPYQRFVMLTGVSKFSKVSVFSKLNNLDDLTMRSEYAAALGYTQEELESYFAPYIESLVKNKGFDRSGLLDQMRLWYNGYRFHQDSETVYNPVSAARFFESGGEFSNFWFATGTPSFLLKLAKQQDFDLETRLSKPVSGLAFDCYELDKLQPLPLLVQTGYLTIKSAVKDEGDTFYFLGFPNREVESAFGAYLLDEYSGVSKEDAGVHAAEMARALRDGDVDTFMEKINIFLSGIPYDIQIKHEKYYQTVFFMVFRMLGLRLETESRTSSGRIDAVAATKSSVYIFEFKVGQSPEKAAAQIKEKNYLQKYLGSGKEIITVGAVFEPGKGILSGWRAEKRPRE